MPRPIIVEIETVIRRVNRLTPQVGQKSLQTISIDFAEKNITSSYTTGKTDFGLFEANSIRDNFFCNTQSWPGNSVLFYVSGETASAVGVTPNINYKFNIRLSLRPAIVSISGSHDGYPSYNIKVNGSTVYDYTQGNIWSLAGDSDIVTAVESAAYRR